MKKAISIKVDLWVESEEEPAQDYARKAIEAVKQILEAGKNVRPEMKIKIIKIKEANDGFRED